MSAATKTPPSPTPQSRRPWKREKARRTSHLLDADGDFIGTIFDPDDADLAVLAVNEHEALLGIVREVEKWGCEDCGRSAPSKCDWCKRVRAILSRIEGGGRDGTT